MRRGHRAADGVVSRLGALAVGIAALELGAGRRTKDDPIDHAVACSASQAWRHGAGRGRLWRRSTRGDESPRAAARGRARGVRDRGRGATAQGDPARRRHLEPVVTASQLASARSTSRGRRPVPRLAVCRSCPRSRPSGGDRARARGGRLEHVEIRDPRLVRPFDPEIVAARARRGARGRGRAPGQVFDCPIRFWSVSAGAPPDDGVVAHCSDGGVGRRPTHACCSQIRQWIGCRLSRCSALRHVGALRAGDLQPYLEARLGPEPLGPLSAARARRGDWRGGGRR